MSILQTRLFLETVQCSGFVISGWLAVACAGLLANGMSLYAVGSPVTGFTFLSALAMHLPHPCLGGGISLAPFHLSIRSQQGQKAFPYWIRFGNWFSNHVNL